LGLKNLPLASGEKHVRAFERLGWTVARPGNHIVMTRPGHRAALSIPNHAEVKRTVLQKLIRAAGVTEQQYLKAFKG
jgi:predicted RNA binding protein YcfA (HicA-like mRNA interferase family)